MAFLVLLFIKIMYFLYCVMSSNQQLFLLTKIYSNLQEKQLIIAVIDDFHCIHTIQDPKYNQTSTCIHMTTEIVDIHSHLPAVEIPQNTIHRVVEINQTRCHGGIDIGATQCFMQQVLKCFFRKSFLESLPDEYKTFNMENSQESAEHLR